MKSFPSSVQAAGRQHQPSAPDFALFAFSMFSSALGIFSNYISLCRLITGFYRLPFTSSLALCSASPLYLFTSLWVSVCNLQRISIYIVSGIITVSLKVTSILVTQITKSVIMRGQISVFWSRLHLYIHGWHILVQVSGSLNLDAPWHRAWIYVVHSILVNQWEPFYHPNISKHIIGTQKDRWLSKVVKTSLKVLS